ncbi:MULTISPECIES: serine hydrolase domain-containing protein [Burkholderia]|uniref:serine hydrolase domain-containing protein n=1 Tax=Burkholderia TaxID=32008 RepID=UPI0008413EC4|nr:MULTISPECIES: serine hydrolase [unclassified Burkholderia]AOK29713.1 serine hydrolase [Burkholderia sp. Bp7605]
MKRPSVASRSPRAPRLLDWLSAQRYLQGVALSAALSGAPLAALAADNPPDGPSPAFIGASTYAKIMCSGLFVAGLDERQIRTQDLADLPPIPVEIDRDRRVVSASLGPVKRTARYRDGLGCTLDNAVSPALTQAASPKPYPQVDEASATHPAPLAAAPLPALIPALDHAFDENDSALLKNTRAVLVMHRGRIVAERYAQGVTMDTPLPGYSMVKGVANLLTGTLVRRGWLTLGQQDLRHEWRDAPDDARRQISVDQLLRMTSGLAWSESYLGTRSDLMKMLTAAHDPAAYAAAKPLAAREDAAGAPKPLPDAQRFESVLGPAKSLTPRDVARTMLPGEAWRYSGGSYEILSAVLADSLRAHREDPLVYPYRALLGPLGMTSAVLEAAPDGNYMLSSFMLATARDWGRLGQFLLDQSRNSARASELLPANWLKDSLRPTLARNMPIGTEVGAGYWLNSLGPEVPHGAFYLGGFQGQFVIVVPDRDLVVVRLGATSADGNWVARKVLEDIVPRLD